MKSDNEEEDLQSERFGKEMITTRDDASPNKRSNERRDRYYVQLELVRQLFSVYFDSVSDLVRLELFKHYNC